MMGSDKLSISRRSSDDGEDDDDEEDLYDPAPKTVHFGSIEDAESEEDHTAMMAGKTRH